MQPLKHQSGFIIYILLFISLIVLIVVVVIWKNFSQNNAIVQEDNELLMCQDKLKSYTAKISEIQLSQSKLENTTAASETKDSSKCQEEIDFWQYLPVDLQKKTYKNGVVSAGESTYDIFPLAWSRDCQRQAFLVELVGRGGDAYAPKDFLPRGLYIFDNKTQKIKLAYSMPNEFTFDEEAYESNFWFSPEKYIFVVTTKKTKKDFVSRRYEYDVNSEEVKPNGE